MAPYLRAAAVATALYAAGAEGKTRGLGDCFRSGHPHSEDAPVPADFAAESGESTMGAGKGNGMMMGGGMMGGHHHHHHHHEHEHEHHDWEGNGEGEEEEGEEHHHQHHHHHHQHQWEMMGQGTPAQGPSAFFEVPEGEMGPAWHHHHHEHKHDHEGEGWYHGHMSEEDWHHHHHKHHEQKGEDWHHEHPGHDRDAHIFAAMQKKSVQYGGNKLERTFTRYVDLPMDEKMLTEAGWTKHNSVCDPHLGFVWTKDSSGATKGDPLKLYTTAAGQLAGVGVIMIGYYGKPALPGPQQKWATAEPLVGPTPGEALAHIDVAFRSGDIVCSGKTSEESVGDTLIVNPAGGQSARTLPVTEQGIIEDGWRRGSCFDGMGWHYFLDTAVGKGQLSKQASNLFPVVTMYDDEGSINAIFFASTNNQVSIPFLKSNDWEPVGLSDSQMCKNTCDSDCTFKGMDGSWSTLHIYFKDHTSVTCQADLECGLTFPFRGNCCDKKGTQETEQPLEEIVEMVEELAAAAEEPAPTAEQLVVRQTATGDFHV